MSTLDTFVAVDIETTGLDPGGAEIIELGAVRVERGEVVDRFQSYAKPRKGIPTETVRLTGITDKEVRKAPAARTVLRRFREFTNGNPIVGHQGRFEERFLSAFSARHFDESVLSARDLARLALPRLIDHRSDTVSSFLGVEAEGPHRALRDAHRVAGAYLGVVDVLRGIPFLLKQQMLNLVQGTESDLLPVLVDLGNEAAREEFMSRLDGGGVDRDTFRAMFNVGGEEARTSSGRAGPLDVDAIGEVFEPGGGLEQKYPAYEFRSEQAEMARAVAEALNSSCFLAVEAGTGVGKSAAYLVPAVVHAVQNDARVVVSTNTKNLQEQLFFKDLPDLEAILEVPFRYVLLKGRGNYICLNRWDTSLADVEALFTEEERTAALPLVVWAEETETGDVSENTGFDAVRHAGLWAKVCSDPGFCRSQRCRNNGRCFANVIRKEAQRAHVVVVNHSLLFSDLSSEQGILGDYQHLVLDEAHKVEKVAAHYLGRELSVWRVRDLTDQLRSSGFTESGVLLALQRWMSVAELDAATQRPFDIEIGAATEAAEGLQLKALSFFEALTGRMREQYSGRKAEYTEKVRYRPGESTFHGLGDALDPTVKAATDLSAHLRALTEWLRNLPEDAFPNQDDLRGELEGRDQACREILDDLAYLTDPDDEGAVYWMELPTRESSNDTRLFSAPLDVSEVLREALYDRMETIIFTSATLGIRGKLAYFLQRMGLDEMPEGRVQSLCLGSPFDYSRQAVVCAAQFVPSPKSQDFQGTVDSVLRDLATRVRRGTLVLFTSYGMLNRSYRALKSDLQGDGVMLLGQGIDGSRTNIMDRFKLADESMLLGTDSFWEGIDVPGEALEILGIVRLPFAVPSEPLVAAQMEELEKEGKDPFLHYSVPEAILRFRQGFGRLIRNRTDRGAVVILDSRVLTTRYGRAFLEALPVSYRASTSQEEMIEDIRTWFDQADADGGREN